MLHERETVRHIYSDDNAWGGAARWDDSGEAGLLYKGRRTETAHEPSPASEGGARRSPCQATLRPFQSQSVRLLHA
jgi:hypothetical protein